MKRLLMFIIGLFLLCPVSSDAGVVKSGTVTQTNCKKSFVDGTAFVDIGVDFSAYASSDAAVSHKYEFRLYDSSDNVARGWIGASGGGETLGADLITSDNDNEAAVMAGTSESRGSIAQSADQAYGGTKSAKFTATADVGWHYSSVLPTVGSLYYIDGWVFLPSGQTTTRLDVECGNATLATITNNDTWTQSAVYGTPGVGSIKIISNKTSCDGDIWYIDDLTIKPVTDCSTNGVHILSTKTGSTQNWASIDALFDYNDSSGYTYKIFVSNAAASWF